MVVQQEETAVISQFIDRLSRVAMAAVLCVTPAYSAHAAMDVLFDYSAPKTFSGSGSSMRYYFDGGTQDVGVSVSGWQASSSLYGRRATASASPAGGRTPLRPHGT